jgi:hypothetical protein
MNDKYHVPSRVRNITDMERIADRLYAGGVADSVRMQLEDSEQLDVNKCREVLWKCVNQIYKMLEQSFCLEQKLEASHTSLGAERRMSLELRVENKRLTEENAQLEKTNRNLKREIEKLMSNG